MERRYTVFFHVNKPPFVIYKINAFKKTNKGFAAEEILPSSYEF